MEVIKSIKDKFNVKKLELEIKNKGTVRIFFWIFFVPYISFMLWWIWDTKALSNDERIFHNIMGTIQTLDVGMPKLATLIPNYAGYGSIYWLVIFFLKTVDRMRLIFLLLLISTFLAIYKSLKCIGFNKNRIYYALCLYLTCPMVWFTGKFIGPEILGFGVGIWGGTFYLLGYKNRRKALLIFGAFFMGISCGIKLYYVLFVIMWGCYYVVSQIQDRGIGTFVKEKNLYLNIGMLLFGFVIGYIFSSPFMLVNTKQYLDNLAMYAGDTHINLSYLSDVLFLKRIEWDLVNSGGLTHTIIAFPVLLLLFIYGIKDKGRNNALFISGWIAILLNLLICCKDRFLGWYMMPVIYFVCFLVPKMEELWIVLLLNVILILPDISYQVRFKVDQMAIIQSREDINEQISEIQENYLEYVPYYFIDTLDSVYGEELSTFYTDARNKIIFIAKRLEHYDVLGRISMYANKDMYGFKKVGSNRWFDTILYQSSQTGL